jgi:hypothetical protein
MSLVDNNAVYQQGNTSINDTQVVFDAALTVIVILWL